MRHFLKGLSLAALIAGSAGAQSMQPLGGGSAGGAGTVTSITAGSGLSGGTITVSGTISVTNPSPATSVVGDLIDFSNTTGAQQDSGVSLSSLAPLANPTFTGTPAAPTPSTADNSTKLATTAYVQNQGYAPLASPALTGTPTAPTQGTSDNSTDIATDAFVKAQGYATAGVPANLTLTNPASAAVLTLLGGKTLTVSNTLTLAGTDGQTETFPSTSATIARIDAAQTFAGLQTYSTGVNFGAAGLLEMGGSVVIRETAPTLSGTGLGTSPAVTNSSGTAAVEITAGSSPANATFTLSMNATHGWACSMSDITSNSSIVIGQVGFTSGTAVFQAYSRTTGATVALNASDVLTANCSGI